MGDFGLKLDVGGFDGAPVDNVPELPEGEKYLTADEVDDSDSVVLGEGAGGVVRLVRNAKTGERIAEKKVKLEDESKKKEVMRELQAYVGVDCANLISFYGAYYEEEENSVALLLEYMDLGSLQDVIDASEPVPVQIVSYIAFQALTGLNYLHHVKKGIHRDLKPGNILLNSKGQAKLTDFGVATEVDNSMASAKTFVGTLQYMAPERLQGKASYTNKADMWSLGLTIIYIATGKHPYEKCTDGFFSLYNMIKDNPAPSVPESIDFPKPMREWLELCMNKEPQKRAGCADLLKTQWMDDARKLDDNKDFCEFYDKWLVEMKELVDASHDKGEKKEEVNLAEIDDLM